MAENFIGIDLGGTNIKAGVVGRSGTQLSKVSIPTCSELGPDGVVQRMCQAAESAMTEASLDKGDIDAIGIGAPGALSHKRGVIISPPNLPGWSNVPVRDMIGGHFNLPTTLENDANAAAWGEFWVGAGKGTDSLVIFTLGTGIGGGIVLNGRFIRGFFDNGAEIGHMIIDPNGEKCNCGQQGCFEAHASASHTARIATAAIQSGRTSSMKAILDQGGEIDTELILKHKLAGDGLAEEVWDATCKAIAVGSINLSHIINPEVIVLSGGLVYAGDELLKPIEKHFRQLRSPAFGDNYPRIVLAQLGNDAGLIGAAGAAKLARDLGEL